MGLSDKYREEGDSCPECKTGTMEIKRQESCSCHINPPCSACVNAPLVCSGCHYTEEVERLNDYVMRVNPANPIRPITGMKLRELDKTRVDWHHKQNEGCNSTMVKEGVYPVGMTQAQVEKEVVGTFGGRFNYFGDGKFKYTAYTD